MARTHGWPLFLVLLGIMNILTCAQQTLTVPNDYPTIQAAIDAAQPGDTVSLAAGWYEENLLIDKPISLVGEGMSVSSIRAADHSLSVLSIEVESGEVLISDLSVFLGRDGLYTYAGREAEIQIERVLVVENDYGIVCYGPGSTSIANCFVIESSSIAVQAAAARVSVQHTEISGGGIGILLVGKCDAVITDCLIGLCKYGVLAHTKRCGWANEDDEFLGTVRGVGNRILCLRVDICPNSAAVLWPMGFRDESWFSAAQCAILLFDEGAYADDVQDYRGALVAYLEAHELLDQEVIFPVLHAYVLQNLGNVQMELGQYTEAAASFRSARDTFAERGMETDVADICLNLGGLLTEMAQYENARASLEMAYTIYTERGQVVDAGLTNEGLGIVLAELGNYQEAVSRLAEARAVFVKSGRELEVASVDQNLGIIHNHFSRHEDAITALLAARGIYVSHSLWVSVADVDGNLGNVFSNMDQYEEALRRYGMAREVYVEQEMLVDVARVNLSIGGVFTGLGLYEEALTAYKDARTTYSSLDLDVQAAEASANIGIIHCLLGRVKDGVQQFEAARAIFDAHGMTIDVAKCDTGIANAYSELGQYDDALAKYETTRAVFLSCEMDVGVAIIDQNMGVVYLYLGKYVEALTSYQSARAVYVDHGMEVDVAKIDANIGNIYRYLGRYEDALKAYEGALALLDETPPLPGMTCSHPAARWMLLSNIGVAHESLKQWEEARQAYKDSIAVIESIRGGFTSEDLKIAWQERTQDVYERLIKLLIDQGQGASAFTYAERCRARTFLDALYQGSIAPDQLISPEAGISSGAVDPEAIDQAVSDARDSLQPNEAVLEYMVTDTGVCLWVITKEGIGDPVLIEYEREQLMNDVITLRQAIENSNSDTIAVNKFLVSFYDKLVKKSLAKLSDGVNTLILIPSGPLWYLPFSALIMTDQAGVLSGGLGTRYPYLVEKFTLAYLPSLASLSSLTKGEAQAAEGARLLALADPELSPDQLREGEGSKCGEEESLDRYEQLVVACQKFADLLVGKEQEEQCVYAGREAQEVRAHVDIGRQVVIYAAHGQFNPYVPLQSKLLLASGGEAANPQTDSRVLDGNYHAWEALLTDYRGTELVVLAACETLLPHLSNLKGTLAVLAEQECDQVELTPQQLEQIVVGDEVVGLARAFLSSGAEAVLGTLWLANPTAIGKLLTSMAEYHKNEGDTWVQALTKAQRELSKDPKFGNPWFWAAYQLIGRWR